MTDPKAVEAVAKFLCHFENETVGRVPCQACGARSAAECRDTPDYCRAQAREVAALVVTYLQTDPEVRERVARALFAERAILVKDRENPELAWDTRLSEEVREIFRDDARAALASLGGDDD